jgi:iron complex outermembrane receptor protein
MSPQTRSARSVGVIALVVMGCFGMNEAIAQAEPLAQSDVSAPPPEPENRPTDAAPAPPAEPVAPSEDDAVHLEEVVITARKTEESLQKVPVSVSAITAGELQRRSIDSLSTVGQSTPNFTFSQQGNSGRSAGVVYIRGVGQADTRPTYDPAVGIYIDGVYLGRMQGNDLGMMEVERVEVLRGPQGTLFGKNTSGGAVNVITKQPDASADGFSGRLQSTVGSRNRIDTVANVNLPLVTDKAALLLSGSRRLQDGYGERVDGQDTGSTDRESGRVSLLLKPWDNFSALLSADTTTYDETNAVMKLVFVNTAAGTIAALNANTDPDYDSTWLSPSDFFSYGTGPNSSRGRLWGSALTLNLDAGWAALKSITAYRHNDVDSELDPDNSPITVIDAYDSTQQHQVSQELQATGKSLDDRLSWVFGLYYFTEDASNRTAYPLLTPLLGDSASFSNIYSIVNDSIAAYGQGSYSLTKKLRVTAGIRFTRDDKDVERQNQTFPGGVPREPTTTKTASSDDVSPRLGLDYQWTPTLMTYVSAAKGYKGGGFNGRASKVVDFTEFDPEIVWTYELGLRSDLFDRRVRFNATAFYSDYTDFQLQTAGSTSVDNVPTPFNIVTNIPKAQIVGGEIELAVVPATGLKLTSGLGLTYAKYTELPTDEKFLAASAITEDSKFVNSPELSATFAAEYTRPLTDTLDVTGRVDYAHKSEIFYNFANSAYLRQAPYGLLNARLTFEHRPKQLSLSLFGTNLTNEHYIVGGFDDATVPNPGLGFTFVNMASPREFGVSVQVRF